jgi:hypothetical protein
VFLIGPAAIPELERRLGTAEGSEEARTHAALILFKHGSNAGQPQLLRALRDGVGPVGTIAECLARSGITEAEELIRNTLLALDVQGSLYRCDANFCSARTSRNSSRGGASAIGGIRPENSGTSLVVQDYKGQA